LISNLDKRKIYLYTIYAEQRRSSNDAEISKLDLLSAARLINTRIIWWAPFLLVR